MANRVSGVRVISTEEGARRARLLLLSTLSTMALGSAAVAQEVGESEPQELEEIVVTGTSIQGVAPTGSQLISVGRDDIDVVAAQTLDQMLSTVPSLGNFGQLAGSNTFIPGLGGGSSVPTIHGITGGTLALFDGFRVAGGGVLGTQTDPSIVPLAAIERVEVVPDGASSIYGSDAVAGVINFITRKDIDGLEATARYGVGDEYESASVSLAGGTTWDGGGAYVIYDFAYNDNLTAGDRDYTGLDQRGRGGEDFRGSTCAPANITVGGVSYALPSLAPNSVNLCDAGRGQDLLPGRKRHTVFARAHQDLTDTIEVFGRFAYTNSDQDYSIAQPRQVVTISSTNPYYIQVPGTAPGATQSVNFDLGPVFGSSVASPYTSEGYSLVTGVNGELSENWNFKVAGNFGWQDDSLRARGVSTRLLAEAAAGTTLSTAINPYGVGAANNPALVESLRNSGFTENIAESRLREFNAVVDGLLYALPSGDLKVALGVNVRRETWDASQVGSPAQPGSDLTSPRLTNGGERTIKSVFGEVFIPLLGEDVTVPLVHALEVSASARYDDYSDFGSTDNPKIGVNWTVVEGLVLRGSWGTSFNAPNFGDSKAVDTRIQPTPAIFGPAFGNLLIYAGGLSDLEPQTATTYSFGFDLKPVALPGFAVSLSYFDVAYENLISYPGGATFGESIGALLDPNTKFPQFRILNPTPEQIAAVLNSGLVVNGPVVEPVGAIFDFRRRNLAQQEIEGLDLTASHRFDVGGGRLTLGINATYFTKYDTAVAAGQPFVSVLDNKVRLRGRGSVGWERESFSAHVFYNHIGRYNNTLRTPVQRVESFRTVDVNFAYLLPDSGWTEGTRLSLNVSNLFDEEPPFYNAVDFVGNTAGYDLENASPLGRVASVQISKTF